MDNLGVRCRCEVLGCGSFRLLWSCLLLEEEVELTGVGVFVWSIWLVEGNESFDTRGRLGVG